MYWYFLSLLIKEILQRNAENIMVEIEIYELFSNRSFFITKKLIRKLNPFLKIKSSYNYYG